MTRNWFAAAMIWAASWIAPRSMRPVFLAYAAMLERFPVELNSGRTYGVITVPWALDAEARGKALLMQDRAIEAAIAARLNIEMLGK